MQYEHTMRIPVSQTSHPIARHVAEPPPDRTAPDRGTGCQVAGPAQGPARRWYPSKARGCGAPSPDRVLVTGPANDSQLLRFLLSHYRKAKPLTENFPPPHPLLSGNEKKVQLFIGRSKLPKFLAACFISHQQFSRTSEAAFILPRL